MVRLFIPPKLCQSRQHPCPPSSKVESCREKCHGLRGGGGHLFWGGLPGGAPSQVVDRGRGLKDAPDGPRGLPSGRLCLGWEGFAGKATSQESVSVSPSQLGMGEVGADMSHHHCTQPGFLVFGNQDRNWLSSALSRLLVDYQGDGI